jgi:hypothetical protein
MQQFVHIDEVQSLALLPLISLAIIGAGLFKFGLGFRNKHCRVYLFDIPHVTT